MSNTSPAFTFELPTMSSMNYTEMDFSTGPLPDNYNKVRGRSLFIDKNTSRDLSMSSTKSSVVYHEKIANNSIDVNDNNSPALSYEEEHEKALRVSKAAEHLTNMRLQDDSLNVPKLTSQHVINEKQCFTSQCGPTVQNKESAFINIPLPYDPDAPTDPEIWSGNFHLVSLHGLIEHLASDIKNIKDSLKFMTKYITNEKIDSSKANNLVDLKGIGEAVWNFISSIYDANWNVLSIDNNSTSLRRKIASKFTSRMQLTSKKTNKEIKGLSLASIKRLSPSILAKSLKKVYEISKFFKSNNLDKLASNNPKSYTQASKQNANMAEVIKIKETFPFVGMKEINQINSIIKKLSKTKLYIQMMTQGPSRKQVIIPMVKDNIDKFMKNSLIHMTNFNRNLRNTKSEVLVDFI